MSIMDCLTPRIPSSMAEEIQEQYDILLSRAGGDTLAADTALLEWLPNYRNEIVRTRVMSALAAAKVEERMGRILTQMDASWSDMSEASRKWDRLIKGRQEPTRANALERLYAQADLEARQGANELMGELSTVYAKMAPKGFMLDADRKLMGDVMDGLIDGIETVNNPAVRAVANELRVILDKAAAAYKSAGGLIGKIENYVPIKHNAAKIRAVGFDDWYSAYRDMTNIDRVVDYKTGKFVTEERFKEIATDMYNDISTDGASRAARQLERSTKSLRFKNPDMFSRRMQARLSSPKNAAAFKRYNDLFGLGDDGMFDLIMSNLESIGRDTGIMRALGPMPYNLNDSLTKSLKPAGASAAETLRSEALFRTLVGHWEGSVDGVMGKLGTNLHNLLSSSLLGTASISALGDVAFASHAARINGIVNANNTFSNYLSGLAGDTPAQLRALHVAEKLSHASVSRFDGTAAVTPTGKMMTGLNDLKNLNHRVSGLERLTLTTGDAISSSYFAEMGFLASNKVGWDDLTPDFRATLQRSDVFPDEWQRIVDYGPDDTGMVSPDWLPDNMSDIARKLNIVNLELRQWATNSPDLRQRMWSTGNRLGAQAQGDIGNVMSSLLFQFKSFPMVVWRNHLVPSVSRAINNDVEPLAILLTQSLFLGATVVQLKEMIKGNPPKDMEDGSFWADAAWQSGFAGLMGDTLFKDPNGYGRNLVAELAGPGIGVTGTIAQKTLGAIHTAWIDDESDNINWSGVTAAYKPLIPLSTLWYFKAAFNRILMDSLNSMDPDFYDNVEKYNSQMQEDRGSVGWWPKGQTMPGGQ